MNKLLRILGVVLGIGLIWGILWLVVATIFATIIEFINPGSIDPGEEHLPLAIGLAGSICGVVFSGLLSIVEKRMTILELPLMRAGIWGILAPAAIPVLAGKDLRMIIILGPLGSVSAMVSITLMRKWARWRSTRRSPC